MHTVREHRIARLAIATLLGLGALLFVQIHLIDGWGRLPWNAYLAMACAISLVIFGSVGLFLSRNRERIASLAFFYYALVFTLIGPPSILAVVMIALFLVALHAMSPGPEPIEADSTEE